MILRHKPEDGYAAVTWQLPLDYCKVCVIYTFCVDPAYLHHGVGQALLAFAERRAKECGVQALRLDVYEKNLPAIRLYKKAGFRHIATVSLGYEAYGLDFFKLYEKLL